MDIPDFLQDTILQGPAGYYTAGSCRILSLQDPVLTVPQPAVSSVLDDPADGPS